MRKKSGHIKVTQRHRLPTIHRQGGRQLPESRLGIPGAVPMHAWAKVKAGEAIVVCSGAINIRNKHRPNTPNHPLRHNSVELQRQSDTWERGEAPDDLERIATPPKAGQA